ncbi:hypothetical protein V6x_05770 [Gimesia chilikensis]|uniref:Uncharacterized protein n=1 Tax=Gimesia chilikensis TaxID=2605989 RepID=A0A517W6P7_9PLAN|nr:hypothetical protein [Gimesia chilikensis]QDU00900.1 hypothetical protein V6x_05770 [Gimesia chilikensis]
MHKVLPALLFGLILGLLIRPAQPQQASGGEQIREHLQSKMVSGMRKEIQFRTDLPDPFYLKQATTAEVAQQAVAAARKKEDQAAEQLRKIKKLFTELITDHPETVAGKEAQQILEKAELRVSTGYGILPKGVFVFTVPITR